jgi:hypothetical protein
MQCVQSMLACKWEQGRKVAWGSRIVDLRDGADNETEMSLELATLLEQLCLLPDPTPLLLGQSALAQRVSGELGAWRHMAIACRGGRRHSLSILGGVGEGETTTRRFQCGLLGHMLRVVKNRGVVAQENVRVCCLESLGLDVLAFAGSLFRL